MENQSKYFPLTGDRRALPVVVLGIFIVLIAVIPFLLIPSPGGGGPITFAVRFMQGIAALVGLGVTATGIYSYRTGNLRPAMAVGITIVGLVIVGAVGGLVETTGGPLIPVWVWLIAAALVILVSLGVTNTVVSSVE